MSIVAQVVASVRLTEPNESGGAERRPTASGRATRLRPMLDVLPAAILCVVAVFEILTIARAGTDTGTDEEWNRAADALKSEWKVGDLVVFAPSWVDPVGRQYFGDLLTIDDAARMDAARYKVIWEVSIRGARSAESAGRSLEEEISVGPILIRRWVGESIRVITDFRAALPASSVPQGVPRPRLSLEEVGFKPHRCILVVPKPDQTVAIDFPDTELGTSIVGYAGLGDVFTRRDVREPGRLELLIDGAPVSEITFGVEDGWVRFSAETTPSRATVTFKLTAIGPAARNRRICFAAEARQ